MWATELATERAMAAHVVDQKAVVAEVTVATALAATASAAAAREPLDTKSAQLSHPLQYAWTLWSEVSKKGVSTAKSYQPVRSVIGHFATVEEFWRLWKGLFKPSQLEAKRDATQKLDYLLFKSVSLFSDARENASVQ